MAENWIIVANNSGARIFTQAPQAPRLKDPQTLESSPQASPRSRLVEVEKLEHPEGKLKSQAIDADRPGRSFESTGMKRHAMAREIDPKKQQTIAFAKRVVDRLENGRRHGEVERLILVAAPEFLGLMRNHCGAELRRLIDLELSLDLAQMNPDEIRAHLPPALFGAAAK